MGDNGLIIIFQVNLKNLEKKKDEEIQAKKTEINNMAIEKKKLIAEFEETKKLTAGMKESVQKPSTSRARGFPRLPLRDGLSVPWSCRLKLGSFWTVSRLLSKMPVSNLRMLLRLIQLMKFHKRQEQLNQERPNQKLLTGQNSMKVSLHQPIYQNKFIFVNLFF